MSKLARWKLSLWRRYRAKGRSVPSLARLTGRSQSSRRGFLWYLRHAKKRKPAPNDDARWARRAARQTRVIGLVEAEIAKYQRGAREIGPRYHRLRRILHKLRLQHQRLTRGAPDRFRIFRGKRRSGLRRLWTTMSAPRPAQNARETRPTSAGRWP